MDDIDSSKNNCFCLICVSTEDNCRVSNPPYKYITNELLQDFSGKTNIVVHPTDDGATLSNITVEINNIAALDCSYQFKSVLNRPVIPTQNNLDALVLLTVRESFYPSANTFDHLTRVKSLQRLNLFNIYDSTDTGAREFSDEIFQLTNLISLSCQDNGFTEIAVSRNANGIENLSSLRLSGNNFKQNLPEWMFELEQLNTFNVSNSNFTGALPGTLQNSILFLDLSKNQFVGEIPEFNGNAGVANFFSNQFTGDLSVLDEIIAKSSDSSQLSKLSFADNQLHGVIPRALNSLRSLQELDFSNNNFNDEIPDTLAELAQLNILRLNDNNLSGTVPSNFKIFATKIPPLLELRLLGNENLITNLPEELYSIEINDFAQLASESPHPTNSPTKVPTFILTPPTITFNVENSPRSVLIAFIFFMVVLLFSAVGLILFRPRNIVNKKDYNQQDKVIKDMTKNPLFTDE